jgi:FHS family glucose/mannose:H+ symporter-like MFS transporter
MARRSSPVDDPAAGQRATLRIEDAARRLNPAHRAGHDGTAVIQHPGAPRPSTTIYVAAFILTGMVTTVLGPILPELLETWHLSDAAGGALFTAQFSGSLSGGAVSGLLVSRIGDARTLALGYSTMCGGLLAIAAGTYPSGVAGAFAAGIGMGFVIPPTNLLVARGRRDRAASALGALNLAWGVGAALWPLIIALAVRRGGTRPALVALALLCVVVAARIVSAPGARDRQAAEDAVPTSTPAARVALFAALIWLYSGIEMALGGWLPELAHRLPAAASAPRSAAGGAAFWAGLSAGRGLIAVRLERRYEDASVFAGLALTSCSIVLLVSARTDLVVLVGAALCGLGLGPVFPVTAAALSREVSIRLAGPLLSLGALGGATLPWMVGVISDTSRSLATGFASLLAAVALLAALHVLRKARASPS